MRLNGGKVRLQIGTQAQRADDIGKALPDLVQHGRKFLPGAGRVIAAVKKIGDLCIAVKVLARRGGDNIAAGRIFPDDRRNLFKLCGGRKRAAAEFHNDGIHGKLLSMEILALFSHKVPRRVNHVFTENRFFGKKSARRRKTSVFLSRTHKAAGQTSGGTRYCQLCKSVGRGGALLRPMGRCKSAQHSVGADDSVGPINIADSPQISEKALLSVADRVVRPYNGMGRRLRICRRFPKNTMYSAGGQSRPTLH